MLLRSLSLENFGLYGGRVELDLTPRRRRGMPSPVVLIGGKNGAGKTTLLEAVRLALYGRRALGARVAQSEYQKYLRGRIHRCPDRGASPTGAAVSLDFDYAEDGTVHRYRVRRAWTSRGRTVVESLVLKKDGAVVTSVPRDEWHHFLQELIPPGVSQLFFFDGEKIREIADGSDDAEQLASAMRELLGIELIDRLRTDLGLYLARHQRGEDEALTARLETVVRDLSVLERRIAEANEDAAQLAATREGQARAAEQARRRFAAEGGDIALRRAQIEAERDELRRQILRRYGELRELANALLPFAVAPRVMRSFRTALREAALAGDGGRTETAAAVREAFEAWRASDRPVRTADWRPEHWADIERFLGAWMDESSTSSIASALKEIGDPTNAAARLDEAEAVARPRAAALAEELAALHARLRDVEALLVRADADAADVLLDDLRLAEQRVGATEATLRTREEELKRLRVQHAALERERARILERQTSAAAAKHKTALAAKAARALAEYERRLLDHKLAQLRTEFVRCFNRLARKETLVAGVRIDPASFEVTLIGRDGGETPKDALSAGEKQVYAIAILWALARSSGRPLPMIIDTPLARLDSDHRSNLVERYLASASHQVVLLSTDTEVDAALVAALDGSVSHAYHLEFDPAAGRTIVRPGYFSEPVLDRETPRAVQQA